MPELPEVETTRAGIASHIEGAVVKRVEVRNSKLRYSVPSDLTQKLRRQTVRHVDRRGKYLLLRFDKGTLLIHLGMSGSLRLVSEGEAFGRHDHVDMVFQQGLCLRYTDPRKFGLILWAEGDVEAHKLLVQLGPEPLSKNFTGRYLYERAQNKKVNIKTLLMDSKVVVGVGNIYANEALFLAGIDPRSLCAHLTKEHCQKLAAVVKQVLKKAIKAGGTTLRDFVNGEGKPGYFQQKLYVNGRDGEKCRRCGGKIEQFKLGQRSTFCCKQCQVLLE